MIKDILSPHRALLSDHTELRAQKNTSRGVSMLGGNLVGNARTEKSGINARVYKNGVYGFASSAEYSTTLSCLVTPIRRQNSRNEAGV